MVEKAKSVRLYSLGRLRARWLLWLKSDIVKDLEAARHGRRR